MKPFITIDDKKYEFNANFSIQKEFKKEYQLLLKNNNEILEDIDLEELAKARKDLKSIQNISKLSKDDQEEKTLEIMSKYPKLFKSQLKDLDVNQEEMNELNEKYCKLMLKASYNMSDEIFSKFEDEVCEDKGIEYVYALFSSIIKTVFWSVVAGKPQEITCEWETNNNPKIN